MGSVYSEISSRHFSSKLSHADSADRLGALEALLARGDEKMLVAKALDSLCDHDEEVRHLAASAIASVGTSAAAEATVEAWERFTEEGLAAAVEALAGIGRPAIVATRKQLHHGEPVIRAAAATALGCIDARTVDSDLATALADRDIRVVRAAARALGRHRAEQRLDDLAVVYRRVPESREAVVEALEQIGTPAALRLLRKALTDDSAGVREKAHAALERAGAA